jgi:sugar transferase (PEP-CTERM system associated)
MILRILKKDVPLRNLLFVVGEGFLIYAGILISAYLRFGSLNRPFWSSEILSKALLMVIICQISLYFNELYNLQVTDTYLELGLRLTKAIGIASISLAIIYYCLPSLVVGRGIFFISLVFLVLLVVSWRFVYNWILKRKMFTEKILLLGSGDLCEKILNEVNGQLDSGYQVAAVISANHNRPPEFPEDIPLLSMYGLDFALYDLAASNYVKKIVVAMNDKRGKLPLQELLRCKMLGLTILEGESFYEKMTGKILAENINPSWFIYGEGFRKSRVIRFAKRTGDLVLATLGLGLSLPLTLIIPVAIKLDSKGPVIYKQRRTGENGRIFKLCKFRSMIDKAESESGPIWAEDDDSRVTRVGRFLRKFRLDEIPQMWNVLKGEMSFIGPRPERPEFVDELEKIVPYYSERHTVKPGISGWAQVSYGYGASVQDALEKLKYDLFYIKNMSILMDLMIILKTVKIVLQQSGSR